MLTALAREGLESGFFFCLGRQTAVSKHWELAKSCQESQLLSRFQLSVLQIDGFPIAPVLERPSWCWTGWTRLTREPGCVPSAVKAISCPLK